MKSTVVQWNSWHIRAGIEWRGEKRRGREKVGDGRAEESSAIGNERQAVISLRVDIDRIDSGTLLEPDAGSHFWKFATWRGLTVQKIYLSFLNTKSERSEREIKETILLIST